MGDVWERVPLARVIESGRSISYGVVQPGAHQNDGVPIVRAGDIRHGRVLATAPLRVAIEIEAAHSRTRLRGGELLMTLVGTVGQTAIAPPELAGWNIARAVGVVPVDPSIGARWVQYALQDEPVAARIGQRLNTTVQATLNLNELSSLPISLPPVAERNGITAVLSALDDKIELNRRMAQTLEEMARALFTSWFVDFDPVRAKAEGRDTGLPGEIVDLFPDHLVDSPLGPIPAGWTVCPLTEIARMTQKSVIPGREPGTIWHHFSIPAFDSGRVANLDPGESIKSGKYVVPADSVLLSKLNPSTPRVWLVDVTQPAKSICSTEFLPFRPVRAAERSYLFELLRSEPVEVAVQSRVTGSTGSRQRVLPSGAAGIPVIGPPELLRARFSEVAEPWHLRVHSMARESAELTQLRDALLPKLVSGAIRVDDPLAFLERMEAVG